MHKLILRCNYLKNAPPAHLQNYINYVGTREGVEKGRQHYSITAIHCQTERTDTGYPVSDTGYQTDA